MNHEKMTVQEAIELLTSDDSFDDFSFRGDDFVPEYFWNSRYHGDDTEEYELPGVSAIWIPALDSEYIIEAIERAKQYGRNIFLLRGESQPADEITGDPNEVCMVTHEIVCIVEIEAA